jgi:hypothetical protein
MKHIAALLICASLVAGCSNAVRRDFDNIYEAALAPPPELSEKDWSSDASLLISTATLRDGFAAGMKGADLDARFKVPGFSISPRLRVESLETIAPKPTCDGCIGLHGVLVGELDYRSVGLAGRATLGVGLNLDTKLQVQHQQDGWSIAAQPIEIYDAHLSFKGQRSTLADLATRPVLDWLTSRLVVPDSPYQLARFGDLDAPVRALRMRTTEKGLHIHVRTTSPVVMAVADAPDIDKGWSARLGVEALMSVARAASFEQGPIDYGIWIDPNDLLLEDDTFTLSVRMWKPKGGAWWRDYEIVGDYTFARGQLKLEPYEVLENRASPGAGSADPLALLAKGRILQSIAAAVNTSLPSSRTQDIAGVRIHWTVGDMKREGEDFVITGDVTYDDVAP